MWWRFTIVAGVVAALQAPTSAHAQALRDVLVSTYLTNPRLEAARARLRATDELVPQALAGWRPRLTADSELRHTNTDGPGGQDSFTTKAQSVGIEQPLYRGGETVASTRFAENTVRSERARLIALEQDVLLASVTAYTDVVRDEVVLDLAIANEERLRRALEATQDRFDVGEVTRTDVAQAEARLAGAVAARITAEGTLQASISNYREVVGADPVNLQVPDPLADLPGTEREAQAIAEANPAVAAAAYDLRAARDNVDVARSQLLPRLSLNGDLSYVDEPSNNRDWERVATVSARLVIPLYQGGAEYSRVRENKQTVIQRRNDLEDTYRTVRADVTSAWEALETARANIRSFQAQVEANQIAFEGVRQEALVGARTTLDVLDAQQELFNAEVDLVRAHRNNIVASYALKAAVGMLTVQDLELPVEPYDSEAHYRSTRNRWFGLDAGLANE